MERAHSSGCNTSSGGIMTSHKRKEEELPKGEKILTQEDEKWCLQNNASERQWRKHRCPRTKAGSERQLSGGQHSIYGQYLWCYLVRKHCSCLKTIFNNLIKLIKSALCAYSLKDLKISKKQVVTYVSEDSLRTVPCMHQPQKESRWVLPGCPGVSHR